MPPDGRATANGKHKNTAAQIKIPLPGGVNREYNGLSDYIHPERANSNPSVEDRRSTTIRLTSTQRSFLNRGLIEFIEQGFGVSFGQFGHFL